MRAENGVNLPLAKGRPSTRTACTASAVTPDHQFVGIDDGGALAAFLVGDGARRITGTAIPVEGGPHMNG